ncbi:DNA translocase SftA [Metalysinibacillus saudimassiliensis]|uniref:DNA translocase SftA n=1 Tax=Metalysinibacillus saudimassiliensis TaxID=1461583 RepID=A0A078ML88_9BACL|nr:DNA translocase SftA [Metalysinibacillus saudimassiliensis]
MNWFKKQLTKIFSSEDEYEEQQQQPTTPPPSPPQQSQPSKGNFTFPLIPDEEQYVPLSGRTADQSAPLDNDIYEIENPGISAILAARSTKKTVHRTKGPALSTEPTIRDMINAKRAHEAVTAPVAKAKIKPTTTKTKPIENTTQRTITSERKTPFKATDVPSPVHGFVKPTGLSKKLDEARVQHEEEQFSIQEKPVRKLPITPRPQVTDMQVEKTPITELLADRTEGTEVLEMKKHETTVEVPQEKVVHELAPEVSATEETVELAPEVSAAEDTVELAPEVSAAEETIELAPEVSAAEDTVELAPEVSATEETVELAPEVSAAEETVELAPEVSAAEDTIELAPEVSAAEDTIELAPEVSAAEETVELAPEVSAAEDTIELAPEVSAAEETVELAPKDKERVLPFNVIMLKSDKEKLAQKKSSAALISAMPSATTEAPIALEKTIEQQARPVNEQVSEELITQATLTEDAPTEKPIIQCYHKPATDLLIAPEDNLEDTQWMAEQGEQLVEALSHFQVSAEVVNIVQGPAVTRFEITIGQGTKVNKIRNLSDDLKLALAAKDIRIEAPIPGKSSIGIEIPNRVSRPVRISEVITSKTFTEADSPMQAALGLDLTGQPITVDLRNMPHGLIAGATGSGKSVCINSILVSLLYKAAPDELRLMLIDPKYVELASYNDIPHLVTPVITDPKIATSALKWAVTEMENRYKLLSTAKVRSIERYNELVEAHDTTQNKMPYMLIVIDELADLMQSTASEVEEAIGRLAQKARACGIHIIVATQRPSVDVITGVIKANIPTRIAFSVSSQIDSRTILDEQGAERLLGRGDMLYIGSGMSSPIRLQGTFVTDDEIEDVVAYVKTQGKPNYFLNQEELVVKDVELAEQDELYEAACHFIYKTERASASALQRQFSIGYNRAARIIDMLEEQQLISGAVGSKSRDVYITQQHLDEMFG